MLTVSANSFAQSKSAQNEGPKYLQDGTVWTYANRYYADDYGILDDRYYCDSICGDTVIEGKKCKIMATYYRDDPGAKRYTILHEEGQKIYKYRNQQMVLFADYGLSLHQKYKDWGEVTKIDSVKVNGRFWKRYWLTEVLPYSDDTHVRYLVEGIGLNNFSAPVGYPVTSYYVVLRGVSRNGVSIFTEEDFTQGLPGQMPNNITVKEGRRWKCLFSYGKYLKDAPLEEYLAGDTVVDGRRCLKVFRTCEAIGEKDRLIGFVHEKNHTVMIKAGNQWYALYVFGFSKGDGIGLWGVDTDVTKVDTIDAGGMRYRRMKMLDKSGDESSSQEGYWIEGIGSDRGFLYSMGWGKMTESCVLQQCLDGDKVIFTKEDFTKAPVVTAVGRTESAADDTVMKVYTTDGRLVYTGRDMRSLPKGIYIVKRGNKAKTVMK